MKKILVAYSSKYNATAEIAEAIGAALRSQGVFEVDVKDAAIVLGLKLYDAVVVGSAIYAGHWQNGADSFLRRYQSELSRLPVWIFASGPIGEGDTSGTKDVKAVPESLDAVVRQIKPRGTMVFAGKLDLSQLGFLERTIFKVVRAPTGDFRDWDAIHEWALSIGESLAEIESMEEPVK